MREVLEPLAGTRHRFRATVARLGNSPNGQLTVLLKDVRGNEGWHVTDHVWVPLSKDFTSSTRFVGKEIAFTALVDDYEKLNGKKDYHLVDLEFEERKRKKYGNPKTKAKGRRDLDLELQGQATFN
jgi:hypothetical protein